MSDAAQFRLETAPDGTVIVAGELDLVNAKALDRRLAQEDCPMLLDLTGVTFMDGAVVRILLAHRDRCTARGEEFRIIATSNAVRRVLELCGLSPIFGADIS